MDYCSRVLQKKNLLEIFNGKSQEENRGKFIDQTVITNYGKKKTYKIEEIDYSMSPTSKFRNDK